MTRGNIQFNFGEGYDAFLATGATWPIGTATLTSLSMSQANKSSPWTWNFTGSAAGSHRNNFSTTGSRVPTI